MDLFERMKIEGHEQVLFCSDAPSGLQAIIAIHSTRLGPALGGCRMWPYPTFDAALSDVLRLSKAMTYKAAISGLSLGGGKSIIWGDPRKDKTEKKLSAFAKYVGSLGGRYVVAEDVGISLSDIERMRQVTPYVAGFPLEQGGSGDPSPATAYGVFCGMRACLEEVFGSGSFQGKKVAIQGMGKVGYALAELLHQAGAKLYISDMDPERVAMGTRAFSADPLLGHEIYRVECDIYAPCALGGSLNERTIPRLSCPIVAGSANNQLETPQAALLLEERKILYAPDYVINAGGLINISDELTGYSKERATQKIERIYDRLKAVFALAKKESISTSEAADRLARERLEKGNHGRQPG
ncbi:MAG TPA: Glu/Leu/Phe/Val dehydrogenase dimerization domain-containing protein [Candidatus Manganitrophaceae bacterium]|nr:Glu/Leu/Phe/Val dehydrogenase dimerization domain-containing protein [Candidatus Manganitrophaceae bacterium]